MSLDYKIGTSVGTMVTLSSLGIIDPQPAPIHYAEHIQLGDGSMKGVGWLQCEWRFDFLSDNQVSALKEAYCPNSVSGNVTIKTLESGGGMDVYSGKLWWMQVEPVDVGESYEDFVLRFVDLERESVT